jgi:hypothetical protein
MKVFDIVEQRVIINENILLIPQFKKIMNKYKGGALDVFCFIYYYLDYKSPFFDYNPEAREATLMNMFNKDGKFTLEDAEVIDAMDLYKQMNVTPMIALLDGVNVAVHRMTNYLKSTDITDGKDGNLAQIQKLVKELGPTISSYDQLKDAVEKEIEKSTIRGNKSISNRER